MNRDARLWNSCRTVDRSPWRLEDYKIENKQVFPQVTGWHENPGQDGSDTRGISVARGSSKTETTNFGVTTKFGDPISQAFGCNTTVGETSTVSEDIKITIPPESKARLHYDIGECDIRLNYVKDVCSFDQDRRFQERKTVTEHVKVYIGDTKKEIKKL